MMSGLNSSKWILASVLLGFAFNANARQAAAVTYDQLYPTYVEACYVTKVIFQNGIPSSSFGHSAMYLKGACSSKTSAYPTLRMCAPDEKSGEGEGVGVSSDGDFANVNWVATDSKEFFLTAGVRPDEAFDADRANRAVNESISRGVFRGVHMNDALAASKPSFRSEDYWTAFQSLSTDYGVTLGRNAYCVKVPVTKTMMGQMVTFLNERNKTAQVEGNNWSALGDNCAHLVYNTFAAAGILKGKVLNSGIIGGIFENQRAFPATLIAQLLSQSDLNKPLKTNYLKNQQWLAQQPGVMFEGFGIHQHENAIFKTTENIYQTDPLDLFGGETRVVRLAMADPSRNNLLANLEAAQIQYQSALDLLILDRKANESKSEIDYLQKEIVKIEAQKNSIRAQQKIQR